MFRDLETNVKYHIYELTNWLNENYECKPISLPTCIKYYNIDALLYFLEHRHSIDERDEHGGTLHSNIYSLLYVFCSLDISGIKYPFSNCLLKK